VTDKKIFSKKEFDNELPVNCKDEIRILGPFFKEKV